MSWIYTSIGLFEVDPSVSGSKETSDEAILDYYVKTRILRVAELEKSKAKVKQREMDLKSFDKQFEELREKFPEEII